MTAFLLKAHDGRDFFTIAGFKQTGETIARGELHLEARGVFTGRAALNLARDRAIETNPYRYQVSRETGERFDADFQIERLSYVGDIHGEPTYDIELRGSVQ